MSSNTEKDKYPLIRVDSETSPLRCKGNTAYSQCMMQRVEDSDYCPMHGGHMAIKRLEKEKIRQYRLTQWGARQAEFADSIQIKTLRDEIGIMRLMLEERLNQCADANQLILQSAGITNMVLVIQKVVESCHKLEVSIDMTIDRAAIVQLGLQIIDIVSEFVEDPDHRSELARRLLNAVEQAGKNDPLLKE